MRSAGAEDDRPIRPGGRGRALRGARERPHVGGRGKQLELGQAGAALPIRRASAVAAGVAAADHDHVFSGGADLIGDRVPLVDLVLLWQEFHGEVYAPQLAPRDIQIARVRGAAGQQQRVVIAAQLVDRNIHSHVGVGAEFDSFGSHLVDAPPDARLLQLEIGNAVHQQSAGAVGPLEDRH